MKTVIVFLVMLFSHKLAQAVVPVKPEYIDLTPAIFGELGFKADFSKVDTKGTRFAFYYPEEIDARVGRTVRVATKGADGVIESESLLSISKSRGYIQLSFDSEHDVEVSVEYGCSFELPKRCQGEREYGIRSVAAFIARNRGK